MKEWKKKMSKDGFCFIILVLLVAWIADHLAVVLVSILLLAAAVMALPLILTLLIEGLRGAGIKVPEAINVTSRPTTPLSECILPREFLDLERKMFQSLGAPKESYDTIMFRFLTLVKALDQNANVLVPSMRNGIAKKMMYEYHRKHGSLEFSYRDNNSVSALEVMRPLDASEKIDFQNFCAAH